MEEKKFSAKTLDEAITNACVGLEVTSDRLGYKVIQSATKGFFGFRAKDCVISAWIKEEQNNEESPEVPAEKKSENAGVREEKKEKRESGKNTGSAEEINPDREKRDRKPVNSRGKDTSRERGDRERSKKRTDNEPGKVQENRRSEYRKDSAENSEPKEPRDNRKKRENRENRENRDTRENREIRESRENRENKDNRTKVNPVPADAVSKEDGKEEEYPKVDKNKKAEEFLNTLFKMLSIDLSYNGRIDQENNELIIDLSGGDMELLLGNRGQTLDALQYITGQVVNRRGGDYVRVRIDIENFRERRKESMEELARKVAEKVKQTGSPVALEPMNPYERRIIHSCLQDDKDIITRSEGEEPYRHVVVCPAKKKRDNTKN